MKRLLFPFLGIALIAGWPAGLFGGQPAQTRTVEIREYQGQQLGSVKDFRENSISGVQKISLNRYRLTVDGLTGKRVSFTYDDLKKMPRVRRLVKLHCVEGWTVAALWEGIPLKELFKVVSPGPEAVTVIFHCADEYTTSLPLKQILERDLIIADRINGISLPSAQGFPFILVAEEKWGYKWARWITRIELSSDAQYQGFWEKKGYNRNADRKGPVLDERYLDTSTK